jgi:hypothetical protein
MARASVSKVMAAIAVVSCLSLPATAQEPDQDEIDGVICHFGTDLMAGAVVKGDAEVAGDKDTVPELPTIEDDGK